MHGSVQRDAVHLAVHFNMARRMIIYSRDENALLVLLLVCVLKQKKIVDWPQHKEVTGSDSIDNSLL